MIPQGHPWLLLVSILLGDPRPCNAREMPSKLYMHDEKMLQVQEMR